MPPSEYCDKMATTAATAQGLAMWGSRGISRTAEYIHERLVKRATEAIRANTIEANDLDASADGWWDAGIWVDGGHDVTIRNNTIRNNLGPGIEVSDADLQYYKYPDATRGHIVTDNTISGNYWALYTYNFGRCPLPPGEILIWKNNTSTNNGFSGTLPDEFEYERGKQLLCSKWTCGEMKACTSDHQ